MDQLREPEKVNKTEARQGRHAGVRYILVISLALAVAAGIYFYFRWTS